MAAIRRRVPDCGIEVLIPDFQGSEEALRTVMQAHPDVLNHNVETVPRLYPQVRPQAHYARSLEVLRRAKGMAPGSLTKSGIMLGLGEEKEEIIAVMDDLRRVGCGLFTIGQYLRPSSDHLPIRRHWTPAEFEDLAAIGRSMGFTHVESGPLVRSSYHARLQSETARAANRAQ
jgi:lipoic acid synthetase